MQTILPFIIIAILVTGLALPLDAFAEVTTPKKQLDFGIKKADVFCKGDLFKVIKKSDGMPKCVKPETAKKMLANDWIKPYDAKKLDQFIQSLQSRASVGTVNKITVIKQTVKPGITKSDPAVDSYHAIFEVCAKGTTIRLPEVIVSSDSETRYVKLVEKINANTCETNTAKIKANNPDTISIQLVNKGGITKKITELESKVKMLTDELNAERTTLSSRIQQAEVPSEFKPDPNRLTKIADLRNQLNTAKDELNRYLFAHNMLPKTKPVDIQVPKSFAGTPLEGVVVNKLSATKQISGQDVFDVVFEMCAGNQIVRVPSVQITSDTETKVVRLGDKIAPKSCQVTGAKIKSVDADSITVMSGESIKKSATASNLEQKIVDLTKDLQTAKLALTDLTHKAPRPADFNAQASELTQKIINLRAEINETKLMLFNFINQIFE